MLALDWLARDIVLACLQGSANITRKGRSSVHRRWIELADVGIERLHISTRPDATGCGVGLLQEWPLLCLIPEEHVNASEKAGGRCWSPARSRRDQVEVKH